MAAPDYALSPIEKAEGPANGDEFDRAGVFKHKPPRTEKPRASASSNTIDNIDDADDAAAAEISDRRHGKAAWERPNRAYFMGGGDEFREFRGRQTF